MQDKKWPDDISSSFWPYLFAFSTGRQASSGNFQWPVSSFSYLLLKTEDKINLGKIFTAIPLYLQDLIWLLRLWVYTQSSTMRNNWSGLPTLLFSGSSIQERPPLDVPGDSVLVLFWHRPVFSVLFGPVVSILIFSGVTGQRSGQWVTKAFSASDFDPNINIFMTFYCF